jgi:ferredoxin
MNILRLAKIVDKKISALRIEHNLCTQNISPKSSCQSCINVCPTNSISIANSKIEINDACIECGICSTVCPTNAILAERPSVPHILEEVARKSKEQEHVFIHCKKQKPNLSPASTVIIPCLAAIPREAWLTLITQYGNLSIYHSEDSCHHDCEISTGFQVWQKELHAAEEMSRKKINWTTMLPQKNKPKKYDENRRELFSFIASEIKTTNKLILREVIGEAKVSSYQEKFQGNSMNKVQKEWENVSSSLIEKLTNEAVQPYMRKRKLLVENLERIDYLKERLDVRFPSINSGCYLCGACSLLCPTDALIQEEKKGKTSITLYPTKCVDCHLCEEICYSKYIKLEPVPNKLLLAETIVLLTEE